MASSLASSEATESQIFNKNQSISSPQQKERNNTQSLDTKDPVIDHWQNGKQLWSSLSSDKVSADDGKTIITVGHACVDSIMPLDLLRYIYLPKQLHLFDPNTRSISYLQSRPFLPVRSLSPKER